MAITKNTLQTARFSLLALVLQLLFIILFGVFVRYPEMGTPLAADEVNKTDSERHGAASKLEVGQSYPFFQDIHVMIFIGFGFLMTFLKRYGFSSVGLNMLVSAFVLQWATLVAGWILHLENGIIHVGIFDIIGAEFAAAAVLISFGAVLGKVSAMQLLVMAIFEVVVYEVNQLIVFDRLEASDVGDSMVVHAFGAYFGLAVSRMIYRAGDVRNAEAKEESVYHSDLFAMIGTIFLWMFWPSFNSVAAVGEGQYRAVINTYFALAACAVVTFAVSALFRKGKFDMVHIQNATLAGGVAVGTMADMIIQPWAALLIGTLAGVLSVVGYRIITPFLAARLGVHDTCGVHNLHGMPGVMSGVGGIICAAVATPELYRHTSVYCIVIGLLYNEAQQDAKVAQTGTLKRRERKRRERKTRHQVAGVEMARTENAAPSGRGGNGENGKRGTKWQGWKWRERKTRHQSAGVEMVKHCHRGDADHLQRTTTDNETEIQRLDRGLRIRRAKKRSNLVNDARIKVCINRFDSNSYTRMQFLRAVSHSMGAHTDSLQIAENSDSENDEADADNAAVSDATAAATAAADNSPTDGDGGDDCEVCLVAPRDNSIALVPCGHRRFWSSCADEVYNRGRGCPICRANISMILRLF